MEGNMFDILIKNGRILDGTGNPWFHGNVGILDGKIELLDKGSSPEAQQIIDAQGKYVAPGFIDIHTHADFTVLRNPLLESTIQQGVTTAIGGNCGFSMAPLKKDLLEDTKRFLAFVPVELDWEWSTMAEFLERVRTQGIAINFGTLVGQGILRINSMGFQGRKATTKEMDTMKAALNMALDEGAVGLSLGLVYAPGSFAPHEELVELAKVLEKRNKILTVHLRDESDRVEESLQEILDVAEQTGVSLEISHLKAAGMPNWGKMERLIEMIEASRKKGVDITFDVYPYNALNTLLTALLPDWVQEGGVEKMLQRLDDKNLRQNLIEELSESNMRYGGWENIIIASVHNIDLSETTGKSFADLAKEQSMTPEETMIQLLYEDHCSTMVICYNMKIKNIEMGLAHPLSMLGSDSQSLANHGELAKGRPHPRNFATFPRFISEFVRNRGLIPLSEAIRKMTSAPAQKLGLSNRGLLKNGFAADLVIFDFDKIKDTATFEDPLQYPTGIDTVIVNGKVALQDGQQNNCLNGIVIS
jgi:N-acyl-D-amino-acid deacylase